MTKWGEKLAARLDELCQEFRERSARKHTNGGWAEE